MSELNERIRIMHYAKELKLSVFRDELEDYINMGISKGWDSVTLMCEMFSKEIEKRTDNRKRQRIKAAQFPQMKYLQDLERDELPPDARATLPSLETLEFIREGRNIVMYGNPGTGKTHIATALGIKACEAGYSVLFTTVPRLLTHIREAKHERTLKNLEARFEKYDMVICDEFGYVSCDKEGGELLFNHLSLRAEKVIEITGSKSQIVFEPLPQDDPRQRKPDITLANEKLNGWQPNIKLDDGLKYTVDYFKKLI